MWFKKSVGVVSCSGILVFRPLMLRYKDTLTNIQKLQFNVATIQHTAATSSIMPPTVTRQTTDRTELCTILTT